MLISATHKASGWTGVVVDEKVNHRGNHLFYFQNDWNGKGTISGWYYSRQLIIPGVNT